MKIQIERTVTLGNYSTFTICTWLLQLEAMIGIGVVDYNIHSRIGHLINQKGLLGVIVGFILWVMVNGSMGASLMKCCWKQN